MTTYSSRQFGHMMVPPFALSFTPYPCFEKQFLQFSMKSSPTTVMVGFASFFALGKVLRRAI
ncbi:hypothetical protein COU36_02060 [Candidatus Micrarchaeota archaeon CG10_big_fil_rev_8_21_14_0_10_59_7]|nr:MAG: hypothetical protein COU36_02060 [Candidatus Micrarchaeota archaeon CG10_big_fil_rev_8_21_14_0_10_59_7]